MCGVVLQGRVAPLATMRLSGLQGMPMRRTVFLNPCTESTP